MPRLTYLNLVKRSMDCNGIKVVRSIEICYTQLPKIKCDIDFLLKYKRNNLTPIFAHKKLAVKISYQLCNKIYHNKSWMLN